MRYLDMQGFLFLTDRSADLVISDGKPSEHALREAIDRATAADMKVHAWCARRQLGCLLGGEEGDRLVTEVDAEMRTEGVRAPDRMASMFVPGRWSRAGSQY